MFVRLTPSPFPRSLPQAVLAALASAALLPHAWAAPALTDPILLPGAGLDAGAAPPEGSAAAFSQLARWSAARPDGHAPIGVMGEHLHAKDEWMVSYRFMTMSMDGNRSGTSGISTEEILQDFLVTPLDMTMNMHMFGFMYAPTDDLTLMAMVPFLDNEMTHQRRNGTQFTTYSEGLGDIGLSGLYRLWEGERQSAHLNAGITLPTGSIEEVDDGPMNTPIRLPYPMQLGSGTFDLRPGATYLGQTERWSWGAQGIQTFRLGENDEEYRLGNRTDLTSWAAWRLSDAFSSSLRLAGARWGNISGADPQIAQTNPMGVPTVHTADPSLRGGKRVDLSAGFQFQAQSGFLQGQRLALEFGVPVYQDLDGPQLETDWTLTFGWQLALGGHAH